MTAVEVDSERARQAASTWIDWGDWTRRTAFEVDQLGSDLCLHRELATAWQPLNAAARCMWGAATALQRIVDTVLQSDVWLASGVALTSCMTSSPGGDVGGRGSVELRSPFVVSGADPFERGRQLLMRALTDAGDPTQLLPDEFELVALGADRFLVVLPGVTDLSHPDPGWSSAHRSARDLDQAALSSWASAAVADNQYAQAVRDAVVSLVPVGSELLLVGHSFGADTALDLAGDPTFNAPDAYRVSHVVAAGYDVDDEVDGVPETTAVLVLGNTADRVVDAEQVAAISRSAVEAGLVLGATGGISAAIYQAFSEPARRRDTVVDEFDGGSEGFGHHPSNYVAHLRQISASDSPRTGAFVAEIGAMSVDGVAQAVAIDISVR